MKGLLTLRNTPDRDTGMSPTQMLLGRELVEGVWRRQVATDTNLQHPATMSDNTKTTAGKRVREDFTEFFKKGECPGRKTWSGGV